MATSSESVETNPRFDWYQSESQVVLTVFVKQIKPDASSIKISDPEVEIDLTTENGSRVCRVFHLEKVVRGSQSSYKILPSKLEIRLAKSDGSHWSRLEQTLEQQMSAVLANEELMTYMIPGSHGSTFGGNPLACYVARTTLDVILEECLIENARKMGEKMRAELKCKLPKVMVPVIRGKGLMNAIEIHPDFASAHDLALRLKDFGLLAKSATGQSIRLTPPLVITEEEMEEGIDIITKAVHSFSK